MTVLARSLSISINSLQLSGVGRRLKSTCTSHIDINATVCLQTSDQFGQGLAAFAVACLDRFRTPH